MKRTILAITMALCLIGFAIGAGTYALFTDSATNDVSAKAGTVDVTVYRDDGDQKGGPMFYVLPEEGPPPSTGGIKATGYWAPGDSHTRRLNVENTGTIRFKITGFSAVIHDGTPTDSVDDTVLKNALIVEIRDSSENLWGPKPLADLIAAIQAPAKDVLANPGGVADINFIVTMPKDIGAPGPADDNAFQGLRALVDFGVHVAQNP